MTNIPSLTDVSTGLDRWPWAPELDALIAAPDHHRLLLENDQVRVLETLIPPGERTAVHTHRWAGVLHIKSWSVFIRYDASGQVLLDSRLLDSTRNPPPRMVSWSAVLPPHSFENVGSTPFHVISVELKNTTG